MAMWRWLRLLRDSVFPGACEACGDPLPLGHASCLCVPCERGMPAVPPPLCTVCGVPLLGSATPFTCRLCDSEPPAFLRARAAGLYRAAPADPCPLASALQKLKYARRRVLATPLGALLAERYPFGIDALLVPVPLHPTRLRVRGFNQAALLAAELGRRRGLRVAPTALERIRATEAQPGLGRVARRHNLAGAFRVRRPEAIRDRAVVVIDDVLTTGATADGCARVLLDSGAARVDVYTVGRAP